MSADWRAILDREVAETSITVVAGKLGYARTSISLLYHGKYPGTGNKIKAKLVEIFAGQITCPHLRENITPERCEALRTAPMPTNTPAELKHWTACQSCPLNNDRKDAS